MKANHLKFLLSTFYISIFLSGCNFPGSENKNESTHTPTPQTTPSPDTDPKTPRPVAQGFFACATKQCAEGKDFCVTQRFTTGGEVIKSDCFALPAGCKDSDCAESNLPAELKEVRKGTFTDATDQDKVKITFHMVNPDGLPLANKVSEMVEKEKLFLRIKDRTLLEKMNTARPFEIENGAITTSVKEMYCQLNVSNGFSQLDLEYPIQKESFRDKHYVFFGHGRRMIIKLLSGHQGFECLKDNEKPFVIDDLKKIFGTLADVIVKE